jgi:uncharacterized membrane protein
VYQGSTPVCTGTDKRTDASVIVLVWLSLAISLVLVVLFPFVFSEMMIEGLAKLHLEPSTAVAVVATVFLGGLVNIPVARMAREDEVLVDPLAAFGLFGWWPEIRRIRRETVIAVNVGGCLIPTGLAIYELAYLAAVDPSTLWAAGGASVIAIAVCHLTARPTPGVGIVVPGLIPALVAAVSALILAPEQAPPVAFVAGVLGPLMGADILHLKDVLRLGSGVMSIGGAGTFDGIVLSGVIAVYLT